MPHLFTSERLGFRNWEPGDLSALHLMCSDPVVMEFFPKMLDREESQTFLERLRKMYEDHGYSYFAVDELEGDKAIGFIGLAWQTYEAPFTPAVDIGWRLRPAYWGKGYATEGAKRCLEFGFQTLNISTIVSVASVVNVRSTHVMEKIGMTKVDTFDHPKLLEHPHLLPCAWYEIENPVKK